MFYVHKNAMDVFIEILKVQYRGPKYKKLRVRWWNVGCTGNPWLIDPNLQTITIKNTDWSNWIFFNPNHDIHPGRKEEL